MIKQHVKSFDRLSAGELYGILRARERVYHFEQHITEPDMDGLDPACTFLWLEDEGAVAGCLRLLPPGTAFVEASIGRLLVLPEYRRRGLCTLMMNAATDFIFTQWGCGAVRIAAQSYLTGYYSSLGFATVSGQYSDAGIPHYEMLLPRPEPRTAPRI